MGATDQTPDGRHSNSAPNQGLIYILTPSLQQRKRVRGPPARPKGAAFCNPPSVSLDFLAVFIAGEVSLVEGVSSWGRRSKRVTPGHGLLFLVLSVWRALYTSRLGWLLADRAYSRRSRSAGAGGWNCGRYSWSLASGIKKCLGAGRRFFAPAVRRGPLRGHAQNGVRSWRLSGRPGPGTLRARSGPSSYNPGSHARPSATPHCHLPEQGLDDGVAGSMA
jgi:hypothetical protein